MTPTQARQYTLRELSDWCKEEQKNCEEKQDHWTIINNTNPEFGMPFGRHSFPIETEVQVEESPSDYWICKADGKTEIVPICDLENRKHLDTDKYNALQSVIDKCNELMNSISVAA